MDTQIDTRTGLEHLDRDECLRLLAHAPLGRLAVVVAGHPLVFPVNFAVDGNAIVFRTDRGTKLHGARHGPVAFECDGIDRQYHTGWSVLVLGMAEEVREPLEIERLPTTRSRQSSRRRGGHTMSLNVMVLESDPGAAAEVECELTVRVPRM